MLKISNNARDGKSDRNLRREKKLWHDGDRHTLSLGCHACPEHGICGGINAERDIFYCLDNCCRNPANCDSVCPNNPKKYVDRIREVGGFDLENVPRAMSLPKPSLPNVVPLLYNRSSREAPFKARAVCLPLYKIIPRHNGEERYANAASLADGFLFKEGLPVVLTGICTDPSLERWWSLGPGRLDAIRKLRDLGVVLVTTPNFSLFTDQPRWDDMHSMKRIALTHEEFLREGMPAALHVNARTERDWDRWAEYIRKRSEVTHIAFEFRTGAGRSGRIMWHVAQLSGLAQSVGRPLRLVVRAAKREILQELSMEFERVTHINTNLFVKTIKRQRAYMQNSGEISWEEFHTDQNRPVDELLIHNWSLVRKSYEVIPTMFPVK